MGTNGGEGKFYAKTNAGQTNGGESVQVLMPIWLCRRIDK